MDKHNEQKKKYLEAYDELSDAIFRYCFFKTSNRERALDITQDTFMKVWEYITEEKREIENIKAFLYKVANNLIIDSRRKKANSDYSLDNMMETGFDIKVNYQEKMESEIDAKDAMKILDELDDKYREVIIHRYINDMSVGEIAKLCGESENTVSVRIHRGLDKLKTIYGNQFNFIK